MKNSEPFNSFFTEQKFNSEEENLDDNSIYMEKNIKEKNSYKKEEDDINNLPTYETSKEKKYISFRLIAVYLVFLFYLWNKTKVNKNKKKRYKRNNISEEKKKFMGRKTKRSKENEENEENEETEENNNLLKKKCHTNLSYDNVIYKIKVRFQRFYYDFMNRLLKQYGIKGSLKPINGAETKKGDKNHNLLYFRRSMRNFLKKKISKKYKNCESESNDNLIVEIDKKKELKKYISISYIKCLNKYFRMKPEKFKKEFGYDDEYLYENIKDITLEERHIWDYLFKYGLIRYYERIESRSTITDEDNN
jgi:hypothetical protein